jgi:hypothetical protein
MGMPLHSYIEVRRVKGLCSEVSHFDPSWILELSESQCLMA